MAIPSDLTVAKVRGAVLKYAKTEDEVRHALDHGAHDPAPPVQLVAPLQLPPRVCGHTVGVRQDLPKIFSNAFFPA